MPDGWCQALGRSRRSRPSVAAVDISASSNGPPHRRRTSGHSRRELRSRTHVTAQAAASPDAIAVVDQDRSLTYAELDARTNRLARYLLDLDAPIGPETVVALLLPRSSLVVEALLAVQKAGAAYLPLDPCLPAERIREILADASAVAA